MAWRGPDVIAHGVHPVRRRGVEVSRHGELRALSDAEGERLWILNESALALWQLCDGETSLAEMVDAICSLCSVSQERARADVDDVLSAFTAAGLLYWSDAT